MIIHQDKKKLCGVLVKTIEGQLIPCVCSVGHIGGHNPFSSNPFIEKLPDDKKSDK